MRERTAGTALVVVALVVASVVVGSAGVFAAAPAPAQTTSAPTPMVQEANATGETNETNATNATEAPLGLVVSSFMQASAANAEQEVEAGLFEARFERSNASERARLVRQRAVGLQRQLEELRQGRERLLATENVTFAVRAEAARLTVRTRGVNRTVEDVAEKADRTGIPLDEEALTELRRNARRLRGPEVAAIATGLTDDDRRRGPPTDRGNGQGPPENRGNGQGPPEDRGNDDGDDTAASENGTDTESEAPGNAGDRGSGNGDADERGPPENRGHDGNDTDDSERGEGPPADRGNGAGEADESERSDGTERGPPADRGNGSDETDTPAGEGSGGSGDGGQPEPPGSGDGGPPEDRGPA